MRTLINEEIVYCISDLFHVYFLSGKQLAFPSKSLNEVMLTLEDPVALRFCVMRLLFSLGTRKFVVLILFYDIECFPISSCL